VFTNGIIQPVKGVNEDLATQSLLLTNRRITLKAEGSFFKVYRTRKIWWYYLRSYEPDGSRQKPKKVKNEVKKSIFTDKRSVYHTGTIPYMALGYIKEGKGRCPCVQIEQNYYQPDYKVEAEVLLKELKQISDCD
jgi:hypothetical protein